MSPIRKLLYIFFDATSSMKRTPILAMITVTTVFLGLLILFGFMAGTMSVDQFIESFKEHTKIVIYLEQPLSRKAVEVLEKEFEATGIVKTVEYVSPEQALVQMKNEWGEKNPIFEALPGNPLPASIQIRIKKGTVDVAPVISLAQKVPGVEEIQYGQKTLGRLLKLSRAVRTTFYLVGGVLAFIIILITANTVKLTIVARADEIEIMRLVGASDAFIRGPFIIEGVLYGFIGGILTLVVGYLLGKYVQNELEVLKFLQVFRMTPHIGLIIILTGGTMGLIGAVVSLLGVVSEEK